jgi:hypothetical protein
VRLHDVACIEIRALFVSAVLAVSICLGPVAASTLSPAVVVAAMPAMFDTEAAAHRHCLRDVVVWLNIPTRIYHEKACVGTGARSTGPECAAKKPKRGAKSPGFRPQAGE